MDEENLIDLNIRYDIPNDAAERLEELSRVTSELRTNLELNSRFTSDQVGYYKELIEISRSVISFQTELNDVLQARVNAESRLRDIRGEDLEYLNQVEERAQTVGSQLEGLGFGRAGQVGSGDENIAEQLRELISGERGGRARQGTSGLTSVLGGYGAAVLGGAEQQGEQSPARQGPPPPPAESLPAQPASSVEESITEKIPDLPDLSTQQPETPPQPEPQAQTQQVPETAGKSLTVPEGEGGSPSGLGGLLSGTLSGTGLGNILSGENTPGGLTELFRGMGGNPGGGILGSIGRALPWVAAATAGMSAVGAGGQYYQGLKNLGGVTGGGAAEGLAYQSEIRTMAMNPFITTDQAREVVMSALSNGYTGREFETVTEFMADNMRQMNMTTAESMELLRTNVEHGGQSIEALGVQLGTVTSLASDSNMSRQAMTEIFRQTSGAAVDLGVSGQSAGELGIIASNMFQDTEDEDGNVIVNPLKGRGGDIVSGMLSSEVFQSNVRNVRDIDANIYEIPDIISEDGTATDEIERVLREQASQVPDAERFRQRLETNYRISLSRPEARSLYDQVMSEEGIVGPALEGIDEVAETEERGFWNQFTGGLSTGTGNTLAYLGGGLGRIGGSAWSGIMSIGPGLSALAGSEEGQAKLDERWAKEGEKWDQFHRTNEARNLGVGLGLRNESLENIVKQYGLSDLELVEGGERTSFDDLNFNDRDTFDRITEGQISVRGQEAMTLSEINRSGGMTGDGGVFTGEGSFTTPQGLTIGLTPEASRVLQIEGSPTQNELQSFYGSNGASLNDPAIGDPRAGR